MGSPWFPAGRKPGSAHRLDDWVTESALLARIERGDVGRGHRLDDDRVVRELQVQAWRHLSSGRFQPTQLPPLALRIYASSARAKPNLGFMAELIDSEPDLAFTVRGSSGGYAEPREANSTLAALRSMGALRAGTMVLAWGLRGSLYTGEPQHALDQLWRGAVGCAVSASLINNARGRSSDKAFLLGLIHDVGRAALLPLVDKLLVKAGQGGALDNMAPEVLHPLHARVGADLLRGWKLPSSMVAAVAYHHHREAPARVGNAVGVLRLAALVHQRYERSPGSLGQDSSLMGHSLVRQLGLDRDRFAPLLALHPGAIRAVMAIPGLD